MKVQILRHQRPIAGLSFVLILLVLGFQNCSGEGGSLKGMDDQSSGAYASTVNPDGTSGTVPVVAGNIFYSPIRMDPVCHDTQPLKHQIIRTYVRHLKRCPDRGGLDWWYHHFVRQNSANSSDLGPLVQSIHETPEFQNIAVPGNTPSDHYCLAGDVYQILREGKVLANFDMSSLSQTDNRFLSNRCATVNPQNVTLSEPQTIRLAVSNSFDSEGGLHCSVPGNALKNSIINHYIQYLDRCPELTGLNFWATPSWNAQNFITSPPIVQYQACRRPAGGGAAKDAGTCYQEVFGKNLCPSGGTFVSPNFCRQ